MLHRSIKKSFNHILYWPENSLNNINIRAAHKADIPLIIIFIKELADFEKFPFKITVTETDLEQNLFGKHPAAEVILIYLDEQPAGFAVYYQTFSTTTGKPGLHLDDIYIRPQFQGSGIGKKVIGHLATIAKQRGYGRFEWWVLDWNKKSINFFQKIGAQHMKELRIFRLQEEDIRNVSDKLDR
jgi:GNAT superfamily N-acetyltransferase